MSDFKAVVHQICFPLGLHPRPCSGRLQCSPDSLAVLMGPTGGPTAWCKGRQPSGAVLHSSRELDELSQ